MPDPIIARPVFDAALARFREQLLHPLSAVDREMGAYEPALREHLNRIAQIGLEIGHTRFDPGLPPLQDGFVEVSRSSTRYTTGLGAVGVDRGLYRSNRGGPTDGPLEPEPPGHGDGGRVPGLWSYLPTLHADEETVGFYRATEDLEDALDCSMAANRPATDQRHRHTPRDERLGADKGLADLEDLQPSRKVKTQPLCGARFFRAHAERMRFAENTAQGLPLGTGVMEGTCTSRVSDRLKRRGMS